MISELLKKTTEIDLQLINSYQLLINYLLIHIMQSKVAIPTFNL